MEGPPIPDKLFEGAEGERDRAARMGRFLLLNELGYFGEKTNMVLARGEYKGSFVAAVRKRFSGLYGDVAGCHPADIEVAATMLGVEDLIFETQLEMPEE